MNKPIQQPRLEAVQVLRAVAALLVVLVHAINSNDYRIDMPRAWLGSIGSFNDFGACGVDMFFVLSGFVMSHAMLNPAADSAGRFLMHRFVRVVPFYWLMTALFFAAMTAIGRNFEFSQFVNSVTVFPLADPLVFLSPVLFVGWTLAFELAFYCVVALVIAVAPRPEKRLTMTLQFTLFLAFSGYALAPSADVLAVWLNPIWFEFALGIIVYAVWKHTPRPISPALSGGLLAMGIIGLWISAAFGFDFSPEHWGILNEGAAPQRVVEWALPSALVLIGLLWLSESIDLGRRAAWRCMQHIGDASYSLYLLHLGIIFVWEDVAPINNLNSDLVIVVLTAFSVILSLGCYRWLELPLISFLRKQVPMRPAVKPVLAQG